MTASAEVSTPGHSERESVITEISDYIESFRFSTPSSPARDTAFKCILDVLAASGAGLPETSVRAIRRLALNTMAAGSSAVWFTGASASPLAAAWANSSAASTLDLDDGNRIARGHPGAAVIPAALAIGEDLGASTEKIISAIVIGYEVGVTIAAARRTYGNTGTWASYAVVATAAALRGTPKEVIAHALAIAGESAPNQLFASAPAPRVPTPEGSAVKEGIPWAVVTGLIALDLAEAGYTGPRNILDSPNHYDFGADLRLGKSMHIGNTYFKLYSCCRHVHAPLDAVLNLVHRHNLRPENIDSITVETTSGALRISNRIRPANLTDAQYSIPYCLALAVIAGEEALLPMTAEALHRTDVESLAARVELVTNDDFDAVFPAQTLSRVTIQHGEALYVSEITSPRGEAPKPLSWADLESKFRVATRMTASKEQQDQVLKAITHARSRNIGQLIGCLSQTVLKH